GADQDDENDEPDLSDEFNTDQSPAAEQGNRVGDEMVSEGDDDFEVSELDGDDLNVDALADDGPKMSRSSTACRRSSTTPMRRTDHRPDHRPPGRTAHPLSLPGGRRRGRKATAPPPTAPSGEAANRC